MTQNNSDNNELENIVNSFKLKCLEKHEKDFEYFIFEILKLKYECLQYIRPYGNDGDWGTEYLCKQEGTFFQVYAPSSELNLKETKNKILKDFKRCYKKWKIESKFKFEKWIFVLNHRDHFKNVPAQIHTLLNDIESKYNIKSEILLYEDIKTMVLNLYNIKPDEIKLILNDKFFDSYMQEQMLLFSNNEIIDDVVHFILKNRVTVSDPFNKITLSVDKEEKILINHLENKLADALRDAIDKSYLIKKYNESDVKFKFEDLRPQIVKMYKKLFNEHKDMNFIIKSLFDEFYEQFPKKTDDSKYALLIIMGNFFELCDVGISKNVNA
jgi:hypothetical protein